MQVIENKRLSVNMRTTVSLLVVFAIAIVLALIVTIISTTIEVQSLSVVLITPFDSPMYNHHLLLHEEGTLELCGCIGPRGFRGAVAHSHKLTP